MGMRTKAVKPRSDVVDIWYNRLNWRDRLIWKVCTETGLRISDILMLKGNELGLSMMVTERKTQVTRRVELSRKLFSQLMLYTGSSEWVFQSRDRRRKDLPVTRQAVWRAMMRATKGLNVRISPHCGRKTFAQELYKATGSSETVRETLGHKYLSTTLIYLFDVT